MKTRRTPAILTAVFLLTLCMQIFAAESDYFNGHMEGGYDMEGTDNTSVHWSTFLTNPTQANWDYYLGYVDGLNGVTTPVYPNTPVPAEYLTACNEQVERTTSYILTQQGSNRLATNYRKLVRKPKAKTAADSINNLSLTFDYSFARVDDNVLGGSGNDHSGSLMLNSMVGDNLMVAFGYSKSFYEINAADWDQTTDSLDFYFTYQVASALNIGAFMTYNKTDIEDQNVGLLTLSGTDFDRWGAGLLAATDVALGESVNLGIIGTLASMNKRTVRDFFDDEDTAGIIMADLSYFATDSLTLSTYISYLTLLDREFGPDGSFFTYGAECELKVSTSTFIKMGYETTGSDNDHQENRINLGVIVNF